MDDSLGLLLLIDLTGLGLFGDMHRAAADQGTAACAGT